MSQNYLDNMSNADLTNLFSSNPSTINRRLLELVPILRMKLVCADERLADKYTVKVVESVAISLDSLVEVFDEDLKGKGYTLPFTVVKKKLTLSSTSEEKEKQFHKNVEVEARFLNLVSTHIYCPNLSELRVMNMDIEFDVLKQFLNPNLRLVCVHAKILNFSYKTEEVLEILNRIPNVKTFIFLPSGERFFTGQHELDGWKRGKNIDYWHVR